MTHNGTTNGQHVDDASADTERFIYQEVIVEGPLAEVWKVWTTKEGLESFFCPKAYIEPWPDGRLDILFLMNAPVGEQGADDMRILAVQPERMLSFTWNAPPEMPEARKQRTSVVVRFKALGPNQTRVRLFHSGWGDGGEWDMAFIYFKRAWQMVLQSLENRFKRSPIA